MYSMCKQKTIVMLLAPGSPFLTKVYDVKAIRVKDTEKGIVGKPVTFLGKNR